MNAEAFAPLTGRPILSLRTFTKQSGISDTTAWRWRRNGWLVTVNIGLRAIARELKTPPSSVHKALGMAA